MRPNPKIRGFTLIELMIVITIIGILAAIAIPAYNNYVVKARVVELIQAGAQAKIGVTEYQIAHGTLPHTNALAGLSSEFSTKYISSLNVGEKGIITIKGSEALGTGAPFAITLTPTVNQGAIDWACHSTGATQYAPASCR